MLHADSSLAELYSIKEESGTDIQTRTPSEQLCCSAHYVLYTWVQDTPQPPILCVTHMFMCCIHVTRSKCVCACVRACVRVCVRACVHDTHTPCWMHATHVLRICDIRYDSWCTMCVWVCRMGVAGGGGGGGKKKIMNRKMAIKDGEKLQIWQNVHKSIRSRIKSGAAVRFLL